MQAPTQSYRIWKTQRSGSTLLYKALTDTGIAGIPGEHFFHFHNHPLADDEKPDPYQQFKMNIWQLGMSDNGVFGVNHDANNKYYLPLVGKVADMRGIKTPITDHEAFWEDVFPNCQHIFLTRRNKIRQAVSWWRAIQDDTWHLTVSEADAPRSTTPEDAYNIDALKALLNELMLKECAAQAYFQAHSIVPLTIVYEDFIANYEGTIVRVLQFLGLYEEGMKIPQKYYRPTADELTEQWVQRLRLDLQPADPSERTW